MNKKQLIKALGIISEYCNSVSCQDCPAKTQNGMCMIKQNPPYDYGDTIIPLFATKFSRTDLQGRWAEELDGSIYCSNCGNTSGQSSNYCSVCGARMKEWAVIDKSNC